MTTGSTTGTIRTITTANLWLRSAACAVSEKRASSRWPAEESQSDYYYAKNQAIKNEEAQSVPLKVLQEEGDDDAAGHRADQDPQGEGHPHVGRNAALLHQMMQGAGGGAGDGGGGQQKRESRRRGPVDVAEQGHRDGDAAARGSRHDGQRLRHADG